MGEAVGVQVGLRFRLGRFLVAKAAALAIVTREVTDLIAGILPGPHEGVLYARLLAPLCSQRRARRRRRQAQQGRGHQREHDAQTAALFVVSDGRRV
eukprot:scaffold101414_cov51-Phaeocystis_antarctica.AAC.2